MADEVTFEVKLKPCPFCGHPEPEMYGINSVIDDFFYVECVNSECDMKSSPVSTLAEAARRWNTRKGE